ncbi:hypothetical protein K450DRAFT_253116 [Umbelopsis ramanniana AG]|uniref:SEC7 domain-containing protein n=1 Tax=Umbelopsis ramanniana AG TaxID=1314678 RepID=A0AAD5HAP4_UMBRA|nr:uncharacterized protein K450DRAFT_253116 [Umbelopsis ramanniana AG]KAI8577157.1 hypothetical protein K450DRAFT_253116 [Umbelopsis ramanniana AG]
MSSPPKQDQGNSYAGPSDRSSGSSRGSFSQRRAERGVDVPVSFTDLRRPSTSSVSDAFGFDNYAFGGVSPVMGSSFSAINEDRSYFAPSPYDQRPEYLQRYSSLRSRYERERRGSRKWTRQSDQKPRDGVHEYSDLATQRDTETDESDIEMPDDDLTGMSPDDIVGPNTRLSQGYGQNLSIPPQLPLIKPEAFSFSFEDTLNNTKGKMDRESTASISSNPPLFPTAEDPDKGKSSCLRPIQRPTDSKEVKWKDHIFVRRPSTFSESPISNNPPPWFRDKDALNEIKHITSGMREQKLDVQEQSRSNSVQSNVDSFFSMAKKVAATPPKATPNPINVSRPRKFLLQTAVFQVINSNTVKDRYLFLFNDLLFIAKPIMDESIMSGLTSSNSRSMSEDSMGGHSKYSDNHRYRFRPTENSLFQVKNIVELSKVTLYVTRDYEVEPVLLKTDADGQMVLPPPRKIHPILASALRKFESDPDRAISYLMEKKILTEDPISIANFLFKTADLSRRQLGRYISNPDNSNVFHAFLDCFRLQGMRLDEALRTFLVTFRLPSKYESLHYVISTFAKKWHDTNQNVVKFHEDMIVKVILAMLRLNSSIWHDRDADQDVFLFALDRREQKKEKMASGSEQTDNKSNLPQESIPTSAEFLERWSIYDQYNLVPKEFMVEMYDSIREEKLETGWDHKYQPHANAMLTKGVPSSKVTIYIPEPDPDLQIKLRGQDLVCQPSILDFSTSRMQTFTITGSTLGRTSLMFIKTGSRAGRYVSPALPRTKAIVVERSFMRHTFQIGFYQTEVKESLFDPSRRQSSAQSPTQQSKGAGEDQDGDRETNVSRREIQRTKRKYMFSVESEESLREWVNQLRNLCGHVNREGHHQISSKDTATKTPEELVSLQVLKEALLADEAKRGIMGLRSMTIDKRASLISAHGGDPLSPPSGSDAGIADDERSKFLSSSNLLSADSGSKSMSAAAAANVVAKRGHEIVKLAVQNSLMPTMLGFMKQSLGRA